MLCCLPFTANVAFNVMLLLVLCSDPFSLHIWETNFTHLGLSSLSKIKHGPVLLYDNANLCYIQNLNWRFLGVEEVSSLLNPTSEVCGMFSDLISMHVSHHRTYPFLHSSASLFKWEVRPFHREHTLILLALQRDLAIYKKLEWPSVNLFLMFGENLQFFHGYAYLIMCQ